MPDRNRPRTPDSELRSPSIKWRKVPNQDLWLHARWFHLAATGLAGTFERSSSPTGFNACPVVFLYRHALELHLKAIVLGDGGNFLATTPDPLSIHKTHSVAWLAQFVTQIVTTLKWEREFKCDGIANLADFKAFTEDLNAVDPGQSLFRLPAGTESQDSFSVRKFTKTMDALLRLLDSTGDALAAEWAIRQKIYFRPN